MKIQHRVTNAILIEGDFKTLKLLLQAAIEKKTNLGGANLGGADLRVADLGGANLRVAKGILSFGPSMDGYMFYSNMFDNKLMIYAGCRSLPIERAREHWTNTRLNTEIGNQRFRIIDFFEGEAKAQGWLT